MSTCLRLFCAKRLGLVFIVRLYYEILMLCQHVWGYFVPRDYCVFIFTFSDFLRGFFAHSSIKYENILNG